MALPKINYPTYSTKLYSNGETVEFRPFNHREEHAVLTAAETDDINEQAQALKSLVEWCTFEKIQIEKLPVFDVEWLFLRMRIQAVEPTVTMGLRCPGETSEGEECGHVVSTTIDLSNVVVCSTDDDGNEVEYNPKTMGPDHRNGFKIMITDDVGMIMRYPTLDDSRSNDELVSRILSNGGDRTNTKIKTEVAKAEIYKNLAWLLTESVFDSDTLTSKNEITREEFDEFYDQFLPEQKLKIRQFIESIPHLYYRHDFKCPKCGYTDTINYRGLQDFFG